MRYVPGQRAEISRKVLHVLAAALPVFYMFVQRPFMLRLLVGCVTFAILVEAARYLSPPFRKFFRQYVGFMVRASEWHRVTGATYVLVGALLAVALFPKTDAITALLIQAISDSAASLIGLHFGRRRFLGKSFAGSGAFFVTALAIVWLRTPGIGAWGLLVALFGTLAEAVPSLRVGRLEMNDNLTVPLSTGAALWLLRAGGVAF